MSDTPQGNPGDILNWPMLKIVYRTDPNRIADLLPPGIEPGADPHVNLTIYNFPVPDVPEYGIVTTVNADYNGTQGEYTLGYGIDQESAIFGSQEINGQPKYPCETFFYRMMNQVKARCIHQGYTFLEFTDTERMESVYVCEKKLSEVCEEHPQLCVNEFIPSEEPALPAGSPFSGSQSNIEIK